MSEFLFSHDFIERSMEEELTHKYLYSLDHHFKLHKDTRKPGEYIWWELFLLNLNTFLQMVRIAPHRILKLEDIPDSKKNFFCDFTRIHEDSVKKLKAKLEFIMPK